MENVDNYEFSTSYPQVFHNWFGLRAIYP